MSFGAQRAKRHGSGHEAGENLLDRLHLIQRDRIALHQLQQVARNQRVSFVDQIRKILVF